MKGKVEEGKKEEERGKEGRKGEGWRMEDREGREGGAKTVNGYTVVQNVPTISQGLL